MPKEEVHAFNSIVAAVVRGAGLGPFVSGDLGLLIVRRCLDRATATRIAVGSTGEGNITVENIHVVSLF